MLGAPCHSGVQGTTFAASRFFRNNHRRTVPPLNSVPARLSSWSSENESERWPPGRRDSIRPIPNSPCPEAGAPISELRHAGVTRPACCCHTSIEVLETELPLLDSPKLTAKPVKPMKRNSPFVNASLLLAALLPSLAQAQPISLSSSWGQYDLQKQQGYSAGLLTLTAQSASGFTATVGSNGIAVGPDYPAYNGYPSKSQYLPRVYTFFAGQPITNNGQRVAFSFDVKFNNVADPGNVGSFRITMGDTNSNNSWGAFMGLGTTSGSTLRYDSTLTQDTNWFNPNNGYYLFMPPDLLNPSNPTNYSLGSFCDFNGSSVGGFPLNEHLRACKRTWPGPIARARPLLIPLSRRWPAAMATTIVDWPTFHPGPTSTSLAFACSALEPMSISSVIIRAAIRFPI